MTDRVMTASYTSESTDALIKRAEQMLGGNIGQFYPNYMAERPGSHPVRIFEGQNGQIKSLAPACNRITIRNVYTVVDSGIIICTGPNPDTCPAGVPAICPATPVTPLDYVNMVANIHALAPQNNVTIRFLYLEDDIPQTTDIVVNLVGANADNIIKAFGTNQQYTFAQSLTLYGVEVL